MGHTIAEKILARAGGLDAVRPGDILWAEPDRVMCNDHNFPRCLQMMKKLGIERIACPEKIALTIDHRPYSDDVRVIQARREMRDDVGRHGITRFYDMGRHGISHNIALDHGLVLPGMLAIASDTRAPSLGCAGALSIALGAGLETAFITGKIWVRVPSTMRVTLTGRAGPGVMSRDIGAWIARRIGMDRADYRVIEFDGPAFEHLDMEARHTLCNAMVDIGVKSAIVTPDAVTADYVRAKGGDPAMAVTGDADAVIESRLAFDISEPAPQVSLPPNAWNAHPVDAVTGEKIHQAFIGSCMGGKMEDLRAAAAVLTGRRIAPGVRLIVIPATHGVFEQATREGLMGIFAAANAYVAIGACGPCFGTIAPLCDGEVCISTSTRNEPGRMGSASARVLLASAATVAASAVKGAVADPREFLS